MRTRLGIPSKMVEATAGTDCFARYSSTKTRPSGAIWIWGDINCAAGATQVLNAATALNMLDCHTFVQSTIADPSVPGNDLVLPGQANDGYIIPAIPSGASDAFDQKYHCSGDWYTALGWDGSSNPGSGQSRARYWKNFGGIAYVNCYLFVSSTGALQFKNGTVVTLVGTYKILVFPQTGQRVTLP